MMTTKSTSTVRPLEVEQDDGQDTVQGLSTDDVFHLLQNERRRAVVKYFQQHEGPADLGQLADWVTAQECAVPVESVPEDARQRVYISLYQSHLPKLDEHDVVDYDSETNVIDRAANAAILEQPLQFEADRLDDEQTDEPDGTISWLSCYLGISLGGFLSLVGTSALAIPASVLSIQALNLILLALYSVTVAGNLLRPRGIL